MITAVRKGKHITRNTYFCKRVDPSLTVDTDEEEEEDDLISDSDPLEQQNNSNLNLAPSGNVPRRYPTRHRGPVRRYGQNIYGQY